VRNSDDWTEPDVSKMTRAVTAVVTMMAMNQGTGLVREEGTAWSALNNRTAGMAWRARKWVVERSGTGQKAQH
jgi:hypothetical protein